MVTVASSTSFHWRILLIVIILCGIGSCCVLAFRNRVGYNVSRSEAPIEGLPADATNISYFLPGAFGPNTFYEFNTSEESFLEWVQSYERLKPVEQGPHKVYRCNCYSPNGDDTRETTIVNGYLYEWFEEDRGKCIAFDKDTSRAYYWSRSR